MDKLLLKHDITGAIVRIIFHTSIAAQDVIPRFEKKTKSFHCMSFNTRFDNISSLIKTLKELAKNASLGSVIILEHTASVKGIPLFEQMTIV